VSRRQYCVTPLKEIGVEDAVEARIGKLVTVAREVALQAPIDGPWREHLAAIAHTVAYRDR
jgi:hypothetical protein